MLSNSTRSERATLWLTVLATLVLVAVHVFIKAGFEELRELKELILLGVFHLFVISSSFRYVANLAIVLVGGSAFFCFRRFLLPPCFHLWG